MIVGLVGKIQSGKTTLANLIKEEYSNTVLLAFGDSLKEIILNSGLCNKEELWEQKTDFSRLMLQKIGTEIIRKQIDENFWINKMHKKIELINKEKLIIIHDLRFINESYLIRSFNGFLVRITRDNIDQNKEENKHLSETEQDSILVDYVIKNDKSLDDLRNEAKKIINLHLDGL